jgi:hypothetical protein
MNGRLERWLSITIVYGLVCPASGLTVSSLQPADYQATALSAGTPIYTDAAATVEIIPPALTGGTLIRTHAADATNTDLLVSFTIDMRAEVYICYDPRTARPAWLTSWVDTGMTVSVNNGPVAQYDVYARRFPAGSVNLSNNAAEAMYFIVVKSSLPITPRNGWVLLSYDMSYLREIIKQAPLYNINNIQLSHDIMMMPVEVLNEPARRNDINELIDLAHAYGITDVALWTHEICTGSMPPQYYASDGRVDGDNSELWEWLYQRYVNMFTPGLGCPEVDSLILTFDEISMFNHGVEVYDRGLFKHDGYSPAQSEAKVINVMQAACAAHGKALIARTWGDQQLVRDAITANGDPAVWMMAKNVGVVVNNSVDWQHMDSYNPIIGTLPAGYKEIIEFDIGGEYMGRGKYTYVMTSYLKDHWNNAKSRSTGMSGLVSRIDRQGSLPYYGPNRLSMYGQREIMANPGADPAAINLAWAQQHFPADAAQDIANSYDAPGTSWDGDTRYMTWEAFDSSLCPVTNTQARGIATTAIAAIDRHRAQLEIQTTLDTRDGKSDYDTLRNGLVLALLDLGGTLPNAYGFSNFRPAVANSLMPNCQVDINLPAPGLHISTVTCEYSVNAGGSWSVWPVTTTGANGSIKTETLTAAAVPFNQLSETHNFVRFTAKDMNGLLYTSGALKVKIVTAPTWTTFTPGETYDLTPDCTVAINATAKPLNMTTACYLYSVDGGSTWVSPQMSWPNRYECDQLPAQAGWTMVEGRFGYESISAGILRINDTGTQSGQKVKYAKSWNVNPSVGATVLARMRCASGGHFYACNVSLSDSLHSESLYLKGNGMIGLAGYGSLVPVTTNTFHTYRITIRNTDINVYLDENPKPIISGNGAFIQSSTLQQLLIGSGASASTQDIYYDYVYWTTQAAFAPNQWFEADYNGSPAAGSLIASGIPFNQASDTLNKICFRVKDDLGQIYDSPIYTVRTLAGGVAADLDDDGDVDQNDFAAFQLCISGGGIPLTPGCNKADLNHSNTVDTSDLNMFLPCMAGANQPPGC